MGNGGKCGASADAGHDLDCLLYRSSVATWLGVASSAAMHSSAVGTATAMWGTGGTIAPASVPPAAVTAALWVLLET